MKIIRPFTVTTGALTSSSIAAVDATQGEAAYVAGTTYALNVVNVVSGTRRYQSLQAANTGHNPATSPTWWLDIGPANRWAMFDQINGTSSSAAATINFKVQTTGRIDSVALLNVYATSARVIARRTPGGVVLYDHTYDLNDYDGIDDWYGYFFADTSPRTDIVVDDLPLYSGMEIEVTLTRAGTVSIGSAIVGLSKELGGTIYGARVGIIDYSRKVVDDFGNYSVVERAFSKRGTFTVVVRGDSTDQVANRVDALQKVLAGYRAVPLVWVGAEQYGVTAIFGFYKSFDLEIAYPTQSMLSLELEGLT